MRVDADTPQELCQIGKDSVKEESQFQYLQVLMLSEKILFSIKEAKQ